MTRLDGAIQAVVDSGNCTGCGACCLLDPGLVMRLNDHGYSRPVRTGPPRDGVDADFARVCPGVVVNAEHPEGSSRHELLGSTYRSWQAWAADPAIRFAGSSGGVITALTAWLLESGRVTQVVAAGRDDREANRTVTLSLTTPSGVIKAAGSRYAPVSNAAAAVLGRADVAVVGKPCEATAVRALARETGQQAPLLISFFCAGTPSQHATDALAARLADGQEVDDLWYRGHGWPGSFTVVRADGSLACDTYDHSWGRELGPTVQWRCKICPDGVGEAADIVAADYWQSDERGYPVFDERAGVSALLARTRRGLEIVEQALAAGVLIVADLDLDALARVQPSQVERRRTLLARTMGARLAGRAVPTFRGFGLLRITRGRPRELVRIARGSLRRIREGRADG